MKEVINLLTKEVEAVDTRLNDVKSRLLESSQLITMMNRGTDENSLDAMHRVCDMVVNNLNYILVYEYPEFDSQIGKILVELEDIETDRVQVDKIEKPVVVEKPAPVENKSTAKRGRKPNSTKINTVVENKPQTLQDVFKEN